MKVSSATYIKVSIIGTYHSVYGFAHDLFKRGVETFPQIESKCYGISGQNLQNFMNILGKDIDADKRLKIGSFMMDATADAVLDGNKFFQRHAAVLGSTGSGKSWCIANIFEKASVLKYTNIIVFDMHGEYKSLAEGSEPIAQRFRIAGPGDLEVMKPDVLFLPYWLLNREELLSMILDRSDSNAPNEKSLIQLYHSNKQDLTDECELFEYDFYDVDFGNGWTMILIKEPYYAIKEKVSYSDSRILIKEILGELYTEERNIKKASYRINGIIGLALSHREAMTKEEIYNLLSIKLRRRDIAEFVLHREFEKFVYSKSVEKACKN